MTPINIITKKRKRRVQFTTRQLRKAANRKRLLDEAIREMCYDNPAAAPVIFPQTELKSCKQLVEEYLALATNLAESTRIEKRRLLKIFSDWVGPRPLSRDLVEQFNAELHVAPFAEGTRWLTGRTLSAFLKWLFDGGHVQKDWTRGIRFPKPPRQKPRENYTQEEIERLLDAAGDRPIGFIIRLGFHTGWSLIDCCELLWSSVDMDKGILRKPRQKTGVESVVTFDFGTPMRAALEAQQQDTIRAFSSIQPGFPVCRHFYTPTKPNGKLSASVMFRRLFETAGVKYRSFHSLRATMLTALGHSDAPLAVSLSVAGLRSPAQLMSYVTPQPEKIREHLRRLRA
jgi:integrase